MAPRVRRDRPFRDPSAPHDSPRFFCVPCDKYLPPDCFYESSIALSARCCIPCKRAIDRARNRAIRAADSAAPIISRTRVFASRRRTPFVSVSGKPRTVISDAKRALAFWQYASSISRVSHSQAVLTLVPADLALPFTPANALLLTAEEAACHLARPSLSPALLHSLARLRTLFSPLPSPLPPPESFASLQ